MKKQTIPPAIRTQVWSKTMGNNFKGKCNVPFCVREIDAHNFDCGHIISEHNGGTLDISNLIPLCRICNSSMGKINYKDYIAKIKKNSNKINEEQEFIPQIEKSNNYTVAFCGLPSSGKSSLINSLVGKRLLQSGVCRTTTKEKLLDEIVTDDDGNEFEIYDLPGIADSEEKTGTKNNFTDITEAYITRSNLIFWVSDVNKAFITTHEVDAYKNIKTLLEKRTRETGDIYDICIMLSKCDVEENANTEKKNKTTNKIIDETGDDEITDDDEDTTVIDIVRKVKEKFPLDNIILFNAYGRSFHGKNSSNVLKQFVKKQCNGCVPLNVNTRFSISKFIKTYSERTENSYSKYFTEYFNKYSTGSYKLDDIYKCYIRLNSVSRQNIILSTTIDLTQNFFSETYVQDATKYSFIKKAFDEDNLEIFIRQYDRFALYLIKYNFFVNTYDQKYVSELYSKLSIQYKKQIMNYILFDVCIFQNEQTRLEFVTNNFEQNGGFEYFDIKQKFNELLENKYSDVLTYHYEWIANIFILFNVLYRWCLTNMNKLFDTQQNINLTKTLTLPHNDYVMLCSGDKCEYQHWYNVNTNISYARNGIVNGINRYFIPISIEQFYAPNNLNQKCGCGKHMKKINNFTNQQAEVAQELSKEEFTKMFNNIISNIKKLTENQYFILATKIRILFDSRIHHPWKHSSTNLKTNIDTIYASQNRAKYNICLTNPDWSMRTKIPDIFLRDIIKTSQEYKNINKIFWNKIFSNAFFTKEHIDLLDFDISKPNENTSISINPIVSKQELKYVDNTDFNPFEIVSNIK